MDGRWFDDLAHSLAAPGTRRRLLGGWLATVFAAVAAAATQGRGLSRAQVCSAEGAGCTLMVPCCAGLVCQTLSMNPNAGACVPGVAQRAPSGTGGTGSTTQSPPTARTPPATRTPEPTATPEPSPTAEPTPTPSPTPDPRDARLEVIVDCVGDAESIRVENTGRVDVNITRVRSLAPESADARNTVDRKRRLAPGEVVRFTSGPGAENGPDRLTGDKLFRDTDDGQVVAVETTAGTFRGSCSRASDGSGGNVDSEKERVTVTLKCETPVELTTVTNLGNNPITIREIRVYRDRQSIRTFSRNLTVPATKTKRRQVVFESGSQSTATAPLLLDRNELYRTDDPVDDQRLGNRVEVDTLEGTYHATCRAQ